MLCAALALAACGNRAERPDLGETGAMSLLNRTLGREAAAPEGGGLCGDPMLVGEVAGPVDGRGACGIDSAVRLRAVGDVQLSQAALIDCTTAKALKTWLDTGAKPAIGTRGGGISRLRVAAHYACRTRNHQKGAKLSEHGRGRAIDISLIRLVDGTSISVLEGWNTKRDGPALRKMHAAACGPFGTVLGPESDRFHKDHFHFDTARHRGGSYCR
ncbi:extensin family protein [Pseudoponticoccus marisrubri]|uniref:Extensin family protein n=1 Tax=Pseudoponticoccus marisrubri TaxID=1685382 RepID=A0A0W7WJ29_9RHOB|nr:extensin family protein [Pseudoponticoccus marisrubri]